MAADHLRAPERTSYNLWHYLVPPGLFRQVMEKMSDFRLIERGHGVFTFRSTAPEQDHSVTLLRSEIDNLGRHLWVYDIHVLSLPAGIIILQGGQNLARDVYGAMNDNYQRMYGTGLPSYAFGINIRKLVEEHVGQVTKLHAQLKNTAGLSAITLYGEDVKGSYPYREFLGSATFVTATVRSPFDLLGRSVTFGHQGHFGADAALDLESVRGIAKRLVDQYADEKSR